MKWKEETRNRCSSVSQAQGRHNAQLPTMKKRHDQKREPVSWTLYGCQLSRRDTGLLGIRDAQFTAVSCNTYPES